jgi:hypothetical protein
MTGHDLALLHEVERLLRVVPDSGSFRSCSDEALEWIAHSKSIFTQLHIIDGPLFVALSTLASGGGTETNPRTIRLKLIELQHTLNMTVGPSPNVAIEAGDRFHYFDEIRKLVEAAADDLFFIDPYLDADFVSRYLVHSKHAVLIRLLTDQSSLKKLMPAVELFAEPRSEGVCVRCSDTLHDRYLIVDDAKCYQSGASFKDGAKRSDTTITQIVDVFPEVNRRYNEIWEAAEVVQ